LNQTVNLRPKTTINDNQTNTKSRQNMLRETKSGGNIQVQFNSNTTQQKTSALNLTLELSRAAKRHRLE
jgi:hypothetical protein